MKAGVCTRPHNHRVTTLRYTDLQQISVHHALSQLQIDIDCQLTPNSVRKFQNAALSRSSSVELVLVTGLTRMPLELEGRSSVMRAL